MYDSLTHKVCLITGAAGEGIGQAVAMRLASEGAVVIITDSHARRTQEVAERLGERFPERVFGHVMDVADHDQVDDVVATAVERWGGIDVLVNNAAINVRAAVGDYDEAGWDDHISVDLTGPWYVMRAVIPGMKDKGVGSIINITSAAAFLSGRMEGPYAATKAALHSLTRAVAAEYGQFGIRSNSVAPGLVESKYVLKNIDRFESYKAETPLGRFATAAEIAAVVAFLVSDEASFITGETICVTGGWFMRG